jgi:hypothetical protein
MASDSGASRVVMPVYVIDRNGVDPTGVLRPDAFTSEMGLIVAERNMNAAFTGVRVKTSGLKKSPNLRVTDKLKHFSCPTFLCAAALFRACKRLLWEKTGKPVVEPASPTMALEVAVAGALPDELGPRALGPLALGPRALGPLALGPLALGPLALGPLAHGAFGPLAIIKPCMKT